MAFTSFSNLAEIIKKYNLLYQEQICEFPLQYPAPLTLHQEISLKCRNVCYTTTQSKT